MIKVKGYTRKDGTRVAGYERRKGKRSAKQSVVSRSEIQRANYELVQEWKQSYGYEHSNLNRKEGELFNKIEREGLLVQKVTPRIQRLHPSKRGYRYLTNYPGSQSTWVGHRSFKELNDWYERVRL